MKSHPENLLCFPKPHALPPLLPNFLASSYLRAFMPSCLRVFVLSCLSAIVPSCLRVFVSSCLSALVPSCLSVFVPSCLSVFVSSCLRVSAVPFFTSFARPFRQSGYRVPGCGSVPGTTGRSLSGRWYGCCASFPRE